MDMVRTEREIEMNQVWDRFNSKVVLCYTGYKERYSVLEKEFSRVGLNGVEFRWDVPSPLKKILIDNIPTTNFTRKTGAFSCCISHYLAIKTAYEMGHENLLIIEDDIRFLEDIKLLQEIVEAIPKDYDYAQFERAKPYETLSEDWLNLKNGIHVNRYWLPFKNIRGGGCYALSRKGMEHMINEFENIFISRREKLQSNDFYVSRGEHLKRYFCYPSVAVQSYITESNSDIVEYWRRNELDGLRFSQYHMEGTYMPIFDRTDFITKLDEALDRQKYYVKKPIHRLFNRWPSKTLLNIVFPNIDHVENGEIDAAIMWGYNTSDRNTSALSAAIRYKAPVIFCEPGFVSSATTWADKSACQKYRVEHSVMMDLQGQFFDAKRETDLEKMLNDSSLIISKDQRTEARNLIDKIVSNKISKYNHQPIFTPKIGRDGVNKVLVIDQSYGDFSIIRGMADESTFEKMLKSAIEDNPESDILVKTHPDTIAGKKAEKNGYYQELKEHDNIYKVTFPINPYSLLEVCDKVYVCSSQFGLEALMAGKEVHVFGMPFYAGWGLTIDAQHLERRTNKRTLEELFYIFYCMYTHWVDPDKGCETTIDAVIDKMIRLRTEYKSREEAAMKSCDDDDFGYRVSSNNVKTSFAPQISTRTKLVVLPRI